MRTEKGMTPREQQLTTMLQKLLAWDSKWPKSVAVMRPVEIMASELDLDDLVEEARTVLAEAGKI